MCVNLSKNPYILDFLEYCTQKNQFVQEKPGKSFWGVGKEKKKRKKGGNSSAGATDVTKNSVIYGSL